jgi:hypothetical protein
VDVSKFRLRPLIRLKKIFCPVWYVGSLFIKLFTVSVQFYIGSPEHGCLNFYVFDAIILVDGKLEKKMEKGTNLPCRSPLNNHMVLRICAR